MRWLKIKNNLYRIKPFWLTKKWLEEKPIFTFWQYAFRGHRFTESNKSYFRLLVPTIPSFLKATVYAIVIILILESYNYFFPTQFAFDKEAIDTLLSVIASIAGVFLGLYFAAISGIASNLLLRAKQDVRSYFLSAPKGQQYVQTIALTAIVSVFYIVTKSFGYTMHPVGLVFLALLAAYIVIRFWAVGSDVFNSLEPSTSLPWITKDIAYSIKNVSPPGFQWTKPAMQNHHRRLVAYNLELIDNLIKFGIDEIKLSDEQLVIALKYYGGLLAFYSEYKRKIPTNSFWYRKKSQHESWLFADSTRISLALHTGTSLHPKSIEDHTWFEEETLDVAIKIFDYLIKRGRIGSLFESIEVFVPVAEIYGRDLDEGGVKMLFKKLDKIVNLTSSIKIDPTDKMSQKELLAFVDSQGRLAIAALLGLAKYLDTQTANNLVAAIAKIDWSRNGSSVYLTGLPLAVISRLESLAREIRNEEVIEGNRISSEWYIKTLCIQKYIFSLKNYFDYVKSLHDDYFGKKVTKLITDGYFPIAAQLIQRWLEFANKYDRLVSVTKKHIEDCNRFHQLKDLPWAMFDFVEEEKFATNKTKEVKDKMISLLPKLQEMVTEDDLPDYFGQALTEGVEACFDACDDNDHERLKKILPIVFTASLAAHDISRKKVQNWDREDSKIIFSTEPLINLFEISGYAKLYAELYQNQELWKVTQSLWDIYLGAVPNAKQVIEFIAALCNYRNSLFMIMPQANLRTNWQIAFEHRMREQGLPTFPDRESYDFVNQRRQPTHASPLIRVIARWGGLRMMTSAQSVFFATYLSNIPAAAGIELPDRHDLRESIQEEEQRSSQEIINEEDE